MTDIVERLRKPPSNLTCECLMCGRMHPRLGQPPWALRHDEACRLSRIFNQASDLRTSDDRRINEWLKVLIERSKP
jgi:hypothetical protein